MTSKDKELDFNFGSFPNFLEILNEKSNNKSSKDGELNETLLELRKQCEFAFTAKSIKGENENYSTGSTYFIRANQKSRCPLEHIAKEIFKFHTRDIDFDPTESGAEWWTQCIDARDDIAFHWDRDYGIEEDENLNVHPQIATVTYLTNNGGPTMIFNKRGSKCPTDNIEGKIDQIYISKPFIGKHIKFDGTLLHAAPSDLLELEDVEDEDSIDSNDAPLRITFLVNIWINHVPIQSVPFPNSKISQMLESSLTPLDKDIRNPEFWSNNVAKSISNQKTVPKILKISKDNHRTLRWKFNHGEDRYNIIVPLPRWLEIEDSFLCSDVLNLAYYENFESLKDENKDIPICYIAKRDSDDISSSEDDSSEEQEGGTEDESELDVSDEDNNKKKIQKIF